MVGPRALLIGLSLLLVAPAARPATLPGGTFEDQEGRTLHMDALHGSIVVMVYGRRGGVDQHVAWGRRLDTELRDRGVYRLEDPPLARPVQILALAQMGGIPGVFRPMLRAALRQHVEKGFSLWLDWEDRVSALFGDHETLSTVVVGDRGGVVRLVVSGPPDGEPYRAVSDQVRRLLP